MNLEIELEERQYLSEELDLVQAKIKTLNASIKRGNKGNKNPVYYISAKRKKRLDELRMKETMLIDQLTVSE